MHNKFYFSLKYTIFLLVSLFLCLNLKAATNSAQLMVTVIIPKYVSLKLSQTPPSVNITKQDIKNGYIKVNDALQIEIKSNTKEGYSLVFNNSNSFSSLIYMTGLENEVQISQNESVLLQPSLGMGLKTININLSFKFIINKDIKEGLYPWPLNVSITPI